MELSKQIRDACLTGSDKSYPMTIQFGRSLKVPSLDGFSDSQLQQLLTLAKEIHSGAGCTHNPDD